MMSGMMLMGPAVMAQQIIEAQKAIGPVIILDPTVFKDIVNKQEQPIVVFSTKRKTLSDNIKYSEYLFAWMGYTFFTHIDGQFGIEFRDDTIFIKVERIVIPVI